MEFPAVGGTSITHTLKQQVNVIADKLLKFPLQDAASAGRDSIKSLLVGTTADLSTLSDEVTKLYFSHTVSTRVGARS